MGKHLGWPYSLAVKPGGFLPSSKSGLDPWNPHSRAIVFRMGHNLADKEVCVRGVGGPEHLFWRVQVLPV